MSDHTMHDPWTDRLSEYLDGELAAGERGALEAHLVACEICRNVLDELRAVIARAGALEDRPPAGDLWAGIARRIGAGEAGARVIDLDAARRDLDPRRDGVARPLQVRWPVLAAAAAALMVVSAGGGWWLGTRALGTRLAGPPGEQAATASPAASFAELSYQRAIRDLTAALDAGRDRLDTATVRVLEHSLNRIDAAIVQARRALAADPASEYLNSYLAETMRRKLELLRRAAALASAES
jgi:tetratricopeptide (TPR) repeat protein